MAAEDATSSSACSSDSDPATAKHYLAFRAVLNLCGYGRLPDEARAPVRERALSVAFPGLGTGVGQVSPDVCAWQVRTAILDMLDERPFPRTWAEASERHQLLYTDRPRNLQRG